MRPRVAVAMAVYNDAKYLPHSLDALSGQSFRDFHLTVLDDESTDSSASVAAGYLERSPMTIHRAPRRGRKDARPAAWNLAPPDAPYLLVLDSDMALPL